MGIIRPGLGARAQIGRGLGAPGRRGAAPPAYQPYLLDFDTLYVSESAGVACTARDFQVASAASCVGARIKVSHAATGNVRLWRTDTAAQVTATEGVALTVGENLVLFPAPVALTIGLDYRLSLYRIGSTYYDFYAVPGHRPGGPVTVLTAVTFIYAGDDSYPTSDFSGFFSVAIEPIIQV